jgi:hypothetical protein
MKKTNQHAPNFIFLVRFVLQGATLIGSSQFSSGNIGHSPKNRRIKVLLFCTPLYFNFGQEDME